MAVELIRQVCGEGPLNQVLIIGEAPGEQEALEGRPFIGKSGQKLRQFCADVGLDKVRFENVVERRPPNNDFSIFFRDKKKSLPTEELLAWYKDLIARIKIIKPKIIITAGAIPLRALTDYEKISDVHCYVLDSLEVGCKIVPVYHPAFVLRQPANTFWLKFGLQKAKAILDGAKDKDYVSLVSNSDEEILTFIREASNAKTISIDIETVKNLPILTAIGFGVSSDKAISITPDSSLWDSVIGFTKAVMEDESVLKIGQNFMFDSLMLWKAYGIAVRGPVWDTMNMANILYSDLKKSLQELGRFYLYCAPWKSAGWREKGRVLREYNVKDIIGTWRIKEHQERELKEKGVDSLASFVRSMFIPAFKLATKGIRVDIIAKEAMSLEVETALTPLRAEVVSWAEPFVPPGKKKRQKRDNKNDIPITGDITAIPAKEAKNYYVAKKNDAKHGKITGQAYKKAYLEELELFKRHFNPKSSAQTLGVLINAGVKVPKVKKSNDEWGESTNEKALKKILERNKDTEAALQFVRNMLIIRHGEKLQSSYCKAIIDSDGRWRCSYNVEGTETGRSSTKKTPWASGGNNQNIPRGDFLGVKFKKAFIPDEGKIFFQADQSQAEARVVAALSGCKTMLRLFSDGADVHEYAASALLGESMPTLRTKDPKRYKTYRQYAKIVNHGGNYDMGPWTLAENALKDGIDLTVVQATEFLAARKRIFPEIYQWHETIKEQLHKDRTLWTPFGRRRVWLGKIGPEMYREAYAHQPQSVVPHITNLMWKRTNEYPVDDVAVLQMGHDSLLGQLDVEGLNDFLKTFLLQTQTIRFKCGTVEDFWIPWDAQTGTSWAEMMPWTP